MKYFLKSQDEDCYYITEYALHKTLRHSHAFTRPMSVFLKCTLQHDNPDSAAPHVVLASGTELHLIEEHARFGCRMHTEADTIELGGTYISKANPSLGAIPACLGFQAGTGVPMVVYHKTDARVQAYFDLVTTFLEKYTREQK